jgi:hypothetical protein
MSVLKVLGTHAAQLGTLSELLKVYPRVHRQSSLDVFAVAVVVSSAGQAVQACTPVASL